MSVFSLSSKVILWFSFFLVGSFFNPTQAAEGEPTEEKKEKTYIIHGELIQESRLMSEFKKARGLYGVSSGASKPKALKKIGAVNLSGKVIQRSGSRAVIQTSGKGYVVVMVRPRNVMATGDTVTLQGVRRRATMNQRVNGEMRTLKQFDDVTLTPYDFMQALNSGKELKGIPLSKKQSKADRLRFQDRK